MESFILVLLASLRYYSPFISQPQESPARIGRDLALSLVIGGATRLFLENRLGIATRTGSPE
ncbi:MAG: hypothetical protein ACK2U2_13395, partial [Anaerolineae bacterium]